MERDHWLAAVARTNESEGKSGRAHAQLARQAIELYDHQGASRSQPMAAATAAESKNDSGGGGKKEKRRSSISRSITCADRSAEPRRARWRAGGEAAGAGTAAAMVVEAACASSRSLMGSPEYHGDSAAEAAVSASSSSFNSINFIGN
uniref:Uncharacterized protein n=1 Tax=Oryza glumipatula TaxID=40148 RepID=A0A0E0BJA2_9ORYZ